MLLARTLDVPRSAATTTKLPAGWAFTFWLQLFVSCAALAFWLIWFFGDRRLVATSDSLEYTCFQNAFVIADGWMIAGCVLGARAQLQRKSICLLWMMQSSSAAIFLGAMDVTFDLQHGLYLAGTSSVAVELAINLLSFGCGTWGLSFAWRHRHQLLALEETR